MRFAGLLHLIGSILVLPYVALALLFLFIADLARARGLLAVLETALDHLNGFILWGIYLVPTLWIALVVMGWVPRLRRTGALALAVLALGSWLVIVTVPSTPWDADQLLVLMPCLAVAAISGWRWWRLRP